MEVVETQPAVQPEGAPAPAAAAEPKFKIGASGTHATQGASVTMDTPPSPPGPAEPANTGAGDAATNNDTPPAEPGAGEPPKIRSAKIGSAPQQSPSEPSPATPAAEPAPPPTWEETLKAQGFDDQFINLAKVYKQEGNISRYAQAMATDYSKMPAEEIHRLNIQREYPQATQEQLELLYESEVNERYRLDSEKYDPNSTDAKAARVKMEMDAAKLRQKFTAENENLKLPSRDVQAEAQQQQQQAAQQRQAQVDALVNSEVGKSVLTDKKLTLKGLSLKDETGKVISEIPDFTMEIEDPDLVKGVLTDPDTYRRFMTDSQGTPDPEANFEVGLFIANRTAYKQALINYGKMLGKEEYVEEKFNPRNTAGTPATPAKESLNEAFANRGKTGKGG